MSEDPRKAYYRARRDLLTAVVLGNPQDVTVTQVRNLAQRLAQAADDYIRAEEEVA